MIDRLVLGGVEKTAIEEVRCLRESGIDAQLLVLKRDGSIPAAFRQRLTEIPFEFLDDRLPRFLRTSWRVPGFYFFSVFHLLYAAKTKATGCWFASNCSVSRKPRSAAKLRPSFL